MYKYELRRVPGPRAAEVPARPAPEIYILYGNTRLYFVLYIQRCKVRYTLSHNLFNPFFKLV